MKTLWSPRTKTESNSGKGSSRKIANWRQRKHGATQESSRAMEAAELLEQGQVTTAGAAEARSAGTSGGKTRGDTVGLAAALQVEIPSPGASMHTCLLLSHKLFLESSCSVVLTCFTTASIKASFLGVHPSECPKYAAKTCIPPLTLTTLERCSLHSQGWTKQLRCLCRPLLPDCCRLRQRLTRRVLAVLTAFILDGDPYCVGCKISPAWTIC